MQSKLQFNKTELNPLVGYINGFCKNINLGIQQVDIPEIWINVNKQHDWNTIHQHGGHNSITLRHQRIVVDLLSLIDMTMVN